MTHHVATITDEAVDQLRAKIGEPRLTREEPTLEEATKDAIRHWARAIGDRDPRWTDEAYARLTPAGGIVAPPSMIYGFSLQAIGDRSGLPGVHSFFGGADHEWFLPIRRNDRIDVSVKLVDVAIRHGEFAGRSVRQTSEVLFTNQNGELVAKIAAMGDPYRTGCGEQGVQARRTSRLPSTRQRTSKGSPRTLRRGAVENPRLGAALLGGRHRRRQLGELIRGPWTATNSVCFMRVYGGQFLKTHSYWFDYLAKHPKAGRPNHQGIPEGPSRGHWDNDYARSVGVPAAYDYGPERIAWLCTLATYWAGDHGTLRKLKVTLRRFNLQGDLTTLAGRVTDKTEVDGRSLVRADISATDQRGIVTAAGEVEIELPRMAPSTSNGEKNP